MGLSQSRVIVETLSEACIEAENSGKDEIETVLSKSTFIGLLQQTWAHLSPNIKRQISRSRGQKRPRYSQSKPKQASDSKITIPKSLIINTDRWKSDPFLFFTEDGNTLDLTHSPLAQSYNFLSQLQRRRETDTIRARFIKVVFHCLKDRLCLRQLRSNNVEVATQIISKSGLVNSDRNDIRHQVTRWANEGRRIDALCRDIGSAEGVGNSHLGNLFCLPGDVHDEFIRVLPLAGLTRKEEIKRLKSRGILDIEGKCRLDCLASNIFDSLWEKIEESITQSIHSSEPGSNWELQHIQSFRIHNAGNSPEQANRQSIISVPHSGYYEETASPAHTCSYTPAPIAPTPRPGAIVQEGTLVESQGQSTCHHGIDETSQLHPGFSQHENIQTTPSPHSFGLHNSQADVGMSGMGSMFDIHANAQPILPPPSFDLHNSQADVGMSGMGSMFDIHANAQPILPPHSFVLHNSQADVGMSGTGSTFDIHDSAQPILPRDSFGLHGGQAMTSTESFDLPRMGIQSVQSEISSDTPYIPAPLGQQQDLSNQPFIQPILVT